MTGMTKWLNLLVIVFLGGYLVFWGKPAGAEAEKSNLEKGIPANITYEIVDSAEIAKISYFIQIYEGSPRLHFEIALKNIAKEPKRFRLNILLPEGPSGGGFYPIQGGAIEPGKTLTQVYPMYFSQLPSGFTIVVSEL
jgi:hypothetical protein